MGDPELVLVGGTSSHFTPARAPSSAGTSRAASWPTPRDDPARHGHRGHRDHGRTRAAGAAEGAGGPGERARFSRSERRPRAGPAPARAPAQLLRGGALRAGHTFAVPENERPGARATEYRFDAA